MVNEEDTNRVIKCIKSNKENNLEKYILTCVTREEMNQDQMLKEVQSGKKLLCKEKWIYIYIYILIGAILQLRA
jgi:hypothetical protein